MPNIQLSSAIALLLCAPSALAQLARDDCASAALDTVSSGTHAFDTSLATTGPEGQNEARCYTFGSSGIERDVWFVYQPSFQPLATLSTCSSSGTHADTKIAVYPAGSCPADGDSLACSDDACGSYSEVTFFNNCGAYLVQLGSRPGAPGGTGTIEIQEITIPPLPGCFSDRGLWESICGSSAPREDFDGFVSDTPFDAGPVSIVTGTIQSFQGVASRNFVDTPPFAFTDNDGTNHASCFVNHDESGAGGPVETRIELLLDPPARAFGADFFEGAGMEGVQVAFYFGSFELATCVLAGNGAPQFLGFCSDFCFDRVEITAVSLTPGSAGEGFGLDGITVAQCPSIGATVCDPAVPNSTGAAATIAALGSPVTCWRNLFVRATDVPPGRFGYFIASETLGFLPNPGGSQGNLCILGNQARYNMTSQIGQGPTLRLDVGSILVPTNPAPGQVIQQGETWYWQLWYRDVGNTSNFSNAVEVTFL